jgi:hypothetical protein
MGERRISTGTRRRTGMKRKDSGYTRTMTKQSTAITNALRSVYDALAPLTAKDRHRGVSAAMVLLEGETQDVKAAPVKSPPKLPAKDVAEKPLPVLVTQPKPSAQAVRDYFAANRGDLVRRGDLIQAFGRDNESTVDQEVSRLIATGVVIRHMPGRYTMPKAVPTKVSGKSTAAH